MCEIVHNRVDFVLQNGSTLSFAKNSLVLVILLQQWSMAHWSIHILLGEYKAYAGDHTSRLYRGATRESCEQKERRRERRIEEREGRERESEKREREKTCQKKK